MRAAAFLQRSGSFLATLCALLVAAAPVAGVAATAEDSFTYLDLAGRYADLRNLAEGRLSRGERASATLLGYLCVSYGKLKQYEKLFECADRLERQTQGGDVEMALDNRWNFAADSDARPMPEVLRARAYFELGEYPKAIASGTKVLAMLPGVPDTGGLSLYPRVRYRLWALEVVGVSAVRVGDLELARRTEKALEDVSLPFLGMRMWKWSKEAAITQVYMALGQYKDVLDHIPDTLPPFMSFIVNSINPFGYHGDDINTILELPSQVMRAKALSEIGRKSEAKAIFDKLLASPRIRDVGDIHWLALFERGRIAETEDRLDEAAAFYRQAVDVVELQRSSVATEASKIGFVGDKQVLYARLVAALIAKGHTEEAFDYIERSKSRALVDMLASKKDFASPTGDSAKIPLLLERVEEAESGGAQTNPAPATAVAQVTPAEPSAPEARHRNLGVSALTEAVAAIPPEVASLVSVTSTPIEEIQARIPEDEALVEYYYDDKSLFIFLLSRQGLRMARADVGSLIADARALRDAIQAGSDAYMPMAQKLYAQLVQPIEPMLAGRSKLIIVPQGVLHYLPFAALNDGKAFLLEKYAFRMLPSASVIKYLRDKHAPKPGGILAFGNPDLGDPKYDLKFAEEEAKAIVQTIPGSRAVVRKAATETALRENAPGFNYLHFATHGQFNADVPLASALVLAKDSSSDGLLTVSKLYSMRLDADLATLSACETGLGKIANGDDIVGLTRGFLFAGTSTIVASLWQVDDQATATLMTSFYEGLKSKDKREALRQAQLATKAKFPNPFFWAAFQLTGSAL